MNLEIDQDRHATATGIRRGMDADGADAKSPFSSGRLDAAVLNRHAIGARNTRAQASRTPSSTITAPPSESVGGQLLLPSRPQLAPEAARVSSLSPLLAM